MSTTSTFDAVAERLRVGISLLEQLHVLSQTQTLLLEASDLAELAVIVEAKEVMVEKIVQAENDIASVTATAGPDWTGIPELVSLKTRALHLIERISEVEKRNQDHLETLREDAIRRSHILRDDQKLRKAYELFS